MTSRFTRRDALRVAGAVSLPAGAAVGAVAGAGSDAPRSVQGTGWPQFQHDAANTGHAPGDWGPRGGVRERWRTSIEGGVSDPVVTGGTVYVNGSGDTVHALDAASGDLVWRYRATDRVHGMPAVGDGTVFGVSRDGMAFAVSADDGGEEWARKIQGTPQQTPTVHGSRVYVDTGYRREVRALDTAFGTVIWTHEVGNQISTTFAVDGRNVYLGTDAGNVHAIGVDEGERSWLFGTDGQVIAAPAVVGDTVYVGSYDGTLYALAAGEGTERWSVDTGSKIHASPAVDGSVVYAGNQDGTLLAVDAASGERRWTVELEGAVSSAPVVLDDIVYVNTSQYLHAIDGTSGERRWTTERSLGTPAVIDGVMYASDDGESVYALESTGTPTPTPPPTTVGTSPPTNGTANTSTANGTAGGGSNGTATTGSGSGDGGSLSFLTDVNVLVAAVAGLLLLGRKLRSDSD